MTQVIELEDVDALGAGAIGPPGQRVFYIQARTESAQLTVVVEKEQVALLAAEAVAFLDRIAADFPEPPTPVSGDRVELREPTVPLFRARLIGLGFDPEREKVLLELREHSADEDLDTEEDELDEDGLDGESDALARELARELGRDRAGDREQDGDDEGEEGYVARIYATRALVRAMAAHGAAVVTAGRPPCPLCDMPMDPAGHRCPRWN